MNRGVAIVAFLFAWTLATHGKYSVSGDEPHYLMITQSVIADHDLDLANNYAGNDGRLFGHDHLEMGPHALRDRQGHLESVHDIGLPWLLVPAYIAAQSVAQATSPSLLARFRMDRGLFAYSLIGLMLITITSIGMGLLAHGVVHDTGRRDTALLVGVAAISPPVVSHSFLVFPEVIALFVTAVVAWYAIERPRDERAATFFAIVAALGLLPWVHRKYALYVVGLVFVIIWTRRDLVRGLSARQRALAAALLAVPIAVLFLWTWNRWGTLGGPQMIERLPFSAQSLQNGLAGLMVDRQSGLLSYAPIYWIVPASWILTWRRTWPLLLPALLLYVPMAAFVEWWAGFAPAARYVTPIVPLCLVAMADAMKYRVVRVALVCLAIPQLMIDAVVWQHPRALWAAGETNPALESLGAIGRAYEACLPAIRVEQLTAAALWIVCGAAAATALLVAVGLRAAPQSDGLMNQLRG
jgi:hypothetical protein